MATVQVIVDGQVVSEYPSHFGNTDLSTEVADSIRGKNRKALTTTSRQRRKQKS